MIESYYDSTNPVLPTLRELRIFLLGGINEDNELPFDLSILVFPIPQDGNPNGVPVGIAILPEITGDIPLNALGKLLNLKFEGGIQAIGGMKIETRPEKTKILFTNPGINKINLQTTFSHRFTRPKVLIGSESSHNIKIFDIGFGITLLGSYRRCKVLIAIKNTKSSTYQLIILITTLILL